MISEKKKHQNFARQGGRADVSGPEGKLGFLAHPVWAAIEM